MRLIRIPGLAAGALLLSATLSAATITITFDAGDPIGGLAVGAVLGSQYAASTGATFSPNAFSGPGGPTGDWATNTDMTIVSSTGGDVGGLGLPALVSGNILRSFSGWLSEDGDPSFQISFATPVTDFSATFAGISTASAVRVFSYNGSTLLDTAAAVAGTGQQVISVSGVGLITSVKVTPGSFDDWVGVDNIAFTPSESAPVPEPSTFVAMALGLTVVSLSRLRRRAKR